MSKSDLIYMVQDNVLAFGISLPPEMQGDKLLAHLDNYDSRTMNIIAGFNKSFLEHFLIISKGKEPKDIEEVLKKMEKVSYMIGPTGNLGYLGPKQVGFILTKIGVLKLDEITENKILEVGDEQLQNEFGGQNQYGQSQALEGQLQSAGFYLASIGYPEQEVQQKLNEARQEPAKIDLLFTLPPKEIQSLPPELRHGAPARGGQGATPSASGAVSPAAGEPQLTGADLNSYIKQIEQDHPSERAQKVAEIIKQIKDHVKEQFDSQYERVYAQMHPDRINRSLKMLKKTKRKSKKMELLLEWYFCSHLIESIEFKVEHWQVSSRAGHGSAGVYTAGILFSRYDHIINDFPEAKFEKVINISRRILRTPSKKAIQKLGQDLISETGFDEHLYFTE